MKIVDNQNRKVLGEGRNYGLGFAFLKRLEKGSYETVQPISPCKDYLNDVVWAENTGKSIHAYGLSYSKKGIFGERYGYLCFAIMDYHSGAKYQNKKKEIELLIKNYKCIEALVNFFEKEYFGLEHLTQILKVEDNLYYAKIPVFWCKATYRISLLSLLIRASLEYDGSVSAEEYLKKVKGPDNYMMQSIQGKLAKLKISAPEQDLIKIGTNETVHDCGILGYNF